MCKDQLYGETKNITKLRQTDVQIGTCFEDAKNYCYTLDVKHEYLKKMSARDKITVYDDDDDDDDDDSC